MIISKTDKTANIAIKLAALALAGKKLETIPYSEEEMEAVLDYAKRSKTASITFMAIEDALDEDKLFDEDSFYFEWKKLRLNSYRRNLLFDKETNAILKYMDENGIWFMPLKGEILKHFYPSPDVREMNDVDILYDRTKRDEMDAFMKSRGYRVWMHHYSKDRDDETGDLTQGDNADEYVKDPFLYFELHKYLIEESYSPEFAKYYANVPDSLVKDENNNCGYHFTDEEFYIYLFVHAHKHFTRNGIGIRFLMDVCVYLNSHPDLDLQYIEKICDENGIGTFERDVRSVALKMFDLDSEVSEESLEKSEWNLFDSMIGADNFGNLETRWKNQVYELDAEGEVSKSKYLKSRLFPDEKWYRIYHPFVYKHKIVKPFFTVYRLTVLAFRGRKNVKKEIDQVGGKDA